MKDSKTLLFIFGLFAYVCTAENVKAAGLTKQGHSASGNDKKVTKREYYAPEYNHERYSYPAYRFEYGVHDPQTGDIKKQYEERDGDSVRGYYSLMEADGSIRLVEYTADSKNGFQAIVKKIGNSHHPMKVTYHMNNAAQSAADHQDGYAPNYHNPNNNPQSLAPVLMHEPNRVDEHQPPAYADHGDGQQRPAYADHGDERPPAYYAGPQFEPPAHAIPQFEPPAYANPHFESPQHQQHQYHAHQPSAQPVREPPALDYGDNRYLPLHQHQLQLHHPPSAYVPYEPQHDTHHYEPPLVPAHHGHQHPRDPEPAFPAADYGLHGSPSSPPPPPPLFAGGLPTAHGDYGSASPDEYHPAPLQFPAASRENDFGWPTAGGASSAAAGDDDNDDEALHRINLDDFQFPAAADFPAIGDDDDERRGGPGPSSSARGTGFADRGASAERPEYLRKYFEPDYRGHDGRGGGGGGSNSFYADDYSDDESN